MYLSVCYSTITSNGWYILLRARFPIDVSVFFFKTEHSNKCLILPRALSESILFTTTYRSHTFSILFLMARVLFVLDIRLLHQARDVQPDYVESASMFLLDPPVNYSFYFKVMSVDLFALSFCFFDIVTDSLDVRHDSLRYRSTNRCYERGRAPASASA